MAPPTPTQPTLLPPCNPATAAVAASPSEARPAVNRGASISRVAAGGALSPSEAPECPDSGHGRPVAARRSPCGPVGAPARPVPTVNGDDRHGGSVDVVSPDPAITPASRRQTGLERRTVRVSVGTAARIRLLAAVLDCPVEHALLWAVPTYLASGEPLYRYRTERRGLLPGDAGDQHLSVALPPEAWEAVRDRAQTEGVRTARVLDAATHPYLNRLERAVSAAIAPDSTSSASGVTQTAQTEVAR